MGGFEEAGYWNDVYRNEPVEELPWYFPELDHDLEEFFEREAIPGKSVLSLGEGPGTQAIGMAKMGYDVTATDISPIAVSIARKRARKEKTKVNFVADDIINTKLKDRFSAIVDRGCFHNIDPEERKKYVNNVYRHLKKDGLLLLKCFSWKEKRPGPYRFTPEDIEKYFGKKFFVESIKESYFEGALESFPKALFAVMRKKAASPFFG